MAAAEWGLTVAMGTSWGFMAVPLELTGPARPQVGSHPSCLVPPLQPVLYPLVPPRKGCWDPEVQEGSCPLLFCL